MLGLGFHRTRAQHALATIREVDGITDNNHFFKSVAIERAQPLGSAEAFPLKLFRMAGVQPKNFHYVRIGLMGLFTHHCNGFHRRCRAGSLPGFGRQ